VSASDSRSAAYTDRRDWATENANPLANLTDELREAFEDYYAKGDLARLLNVEALLREADRAPAR
jgi:hypothetical protein